MQTPLVIGIDPGFASFGWAMLTPDGEVVGLGVLRTAPSDKKAKVLASHDNVRRTRELARDFGALLDGRMPGKPEEYQHTPFGQAPSEGGAAVRLIAAESMSFPRNASAASKMAMAWGMIVGAATLRDLPLVQASPQTVKKRICGDMKASKKDIENAMVARYGQGLFRMLKGVPAGSHEHAFDALAVARACLDSDEARMLRQMAKK